MDWTKASVIVSGVLVCLILTGCPSRKEKVFQDSSAPEWSYDQPFYMRPANGQQGLTRFDGPASEVYVSKRQLAIPRPRVNDPRKAPRTAIWVTTDAASTWQKVGYFGLQQGYFYLPVDTDGDYGIRFIGPGIPPSRCRPPKPHIVFHVDTTPPEITVFVQPSAEHYLPGEMLGVEWEASDINLKPQSVRVGVCLNSELAEFDWSPLGLTHPRIGLEQLVIPTEAVDKVMRIRVTAEDRAGNLGFGYSCPIPVVIEPPEPRAVPATRPGATRPTTQRADSGAKVYIRENTPQILTTMPVEYPDLEEPAKPAEDK